MRPTTLGHIYDTLLCPFGETGSKYSEGGIKGKSNNHLFFCINNRSIFLPLIMFLCVNGSVYASEFCDGFSEGYKTVKGDMVIVPICPIEPITYAFN
jgi:hypothetical protein